MRKFSVILIIALLLTFLGSRFIDNGIKKFNTYSYNRLKELIEGNTNYDLLFVGTSRTQIHINPQIVDSILHLNTYNAGKAGASSLEIRMLLQAYLTTHKAPKYIVYNIDHLSILNANIVPNSTLYLYFLDNDAILNGLKNNYERLEIIKYLPFTRIMSLDDYYRNIGIQGNMGQTEIMKGRIYYKGFSSNDDEVIKKIVPVAPIKIENPSLIEINKIIDICNKNKIKLIFHYGPTLFQNNIATSQQTVPEIENLALLNHIPFLKLDTSRAFDQNDFYDLVHLNKSGSTKYSRIFSTYLNQIIYNLNTEQP